MGVEGRMAALNMGLVVPGFRDQAPMAMVWTTVSPRDGLGPFRLLQYGHLTATTSYQDLGDLLADVITAATEHAPYIRLQVHGHHAGPEATQDVLEPLRERSWPGVAVSSTRTSQHAPDQGAELTRLEGALLGRLRSLVGAHYLVVDDQGEPGRLLVEDLQRCLWHPNGATAFPQSHQRLVALGCALHAAYTQLGRQVLRMWQYVKVDGDERDRLARQLGEHEEDARAWAQEAATALSGAERDAMADISRWYAEAAEVARRLLGQGWRQEPPGAGPLYAWTVRMLPDDDVARLKVQREGLRRMLLRPLAPGQLQRARRRAARVDELLSRHREGARQRQEWDLLEHRYGVGQARMIAEEEWSRLMRGFLPGVSGPDGRPVHVTQLGAHQETTEDVRRDEGLARSVERGRGRSPEPGLNGTVSRWKQARDGVFSPDTRRASPPADTRRGDDRNGHVEVDDEPVEVDQAAPAAHAGG